jgi:SAM-dependent methyltransferase
MDERRALSFSLGAARYDVHRARYPDAVFHAIATHLPHKESPRILEIGAGSGLASEDARRHLNAHLTLVEPGPEFVPILERKFAEDDHVRIVNSFIESLPADGAYDCVMSATAFHWVPEDSRYPIAAAQLRPGGILAVFWNNYSRSDAPVFDAIAEAYMEHHPAPGTERDIRSLQMRQIEARREQAQASGLFTLIHTDLVTTERRYSAQEYVGLLKTFSSNAVQPAGALEAFYERIHAIICDNGGTILLPVLTDFIIARKRDA